MATSSEIEKLQRRWDENPLGLTFAPLAEAYRKSGDVTKALELLDLGLAQHPHYVPAHIVRGRCHLDAHADGEAELAFLRVTELDAENVIALRGLAELSERAGRLPDAIRRLEMLLEIDRNNEDARGHLEHLRELLAGQSEAGGHAAPDVFDLSGDRTPESIPVSAEVVPEEVMRGQAFDATSLSDLRVLEPEELTAAASNEFQRPSDAESLHPSEDRLPDVVLGTESPEMDLLPAEPETVPEPRDWSPFVADIPPGPLVEVQPPPPEPSSVESDAAPTEPSEPVVAEQAMAGEASPEPEGRVDADVASHTEVEVQPVAAEPPPAIETPPVAQAEPPAEPEPISIEPPEPVVASRGPVEAEPEKQPWWKLPLEPLEGEVAGAASVEPEPAVTSGPMSEPAPEPAGEPTAESEAAAAPAEPELVVTETMAEIFLRQGHRELALAVYSQLAQRDPSNERIAAALASLHAEIAPANAPPAPSPRFDAAATGGRSVAELFSSLLSASRPSVAATVHPPAFETPRRPAGEPTRPAQESLSLSAVFGEEAGQSPPAGGTPEVREGEPSFDEFFAPAAGTSSDAELPKAAPAEGAATPAQVPEDLEQFNAWLRGLKR